MVYIGYDSVCPAVLVWMFGTGEKPYPSWD